MEKTPESRHSPGAYDPFSPEVQRDPYPYYEALRRDAPVYLVPGKGMWAVSRHADVSFALKRPDLFSSSIMADKEELPASETLLASDPPAHTGLRKRVERAFSPRRVRELEPRLRVLAGALTAAFAGARRCDIVASLAAPLPVVLIAELMAIDPGRHDDFKRWADAVIARGTGRPLPEARRRELDVTVGELKAFLVDAIAARRLAPGDDLLSALVRDDDQGEGLSPAQVLNFAVLLLLGGSETTTNLIGNALRALFAHPSQLARVVADRSLVPALVDETLRHDAPVQSVLRRTTQALTLGEQRLPAGAVVLLLLASANRDEQVFTEAHAFRLDRAEPKQLAFGNGPRSRRSWRWGRPASSRPRSPCSTPSCCADRARSSWPSTPCRCGRHPAATQAGGYERLSVRSLRCGAIFWCSKTISSSRLRSEDHSFAN
jgi:cytochrome P450